MRVFVFVLLFLAHGLAFAQAEEIAHPDPAVEARLKNLGEELRCLVCQNQTIADSNAPLALDLRNQIRLQVREGKSDDEIRAYMTARYGDFVLYKPPFKATTAVLWIGPFALVAAGFAIIVFVVRRRRPAAGAGAPKKERREDIAALLDRGSEVRPDDFPTPTPPPARASARAAPPPR